MKKSICLFFVFALFMPSLQAHELVNKQASYGVGAVGGSLLGRGLSLRKYMGKNYIQATGIYTNYSQFSTNSYANGAITFGRYLHKEHIFAVQIPVGIVAFAGVNGIYDKNEVTRPTKVEEIPITEIETKKQFITGAGLGLEFFNPGTQGISAWISFSYATRFDFDDKLALNSYQLYGASGFNYSW